MSKPSSLARLNNQALLGPEVQKVKLDEKVMSNGLFQLNWGSGESEGKERDV